MKSSPRSLAADLLDRIDQTGSFAEPLLDACLNRQVLRSAPDRHLLTSLVYGTLRMRGQLDWIVQQLYKGNFASMQDGIKNILRTALYQFLFLERIPVFALVNEAVELTKQRYPGRENLVNALLRNAIRRAKNNDFSYPDLGKDPEKHIAVLFSHPPWLVRRWISIYGPERTLSLCRANNQVPPVAIRVNALKTTRPALKGLLEEEGFSVTESHFSPDGLLITGSSDTLRSSSANRQGLFILQDEASQLIARLAAPEGGEEILDLCCGAGVKTTHLAARMKNAGRILAVDLYPAKLESLKRLSTKMGISIIDTLQADASKEWEKVFQEKFDRVLVDAPCSGLGTLRRNPEIKWRLQPQELSSYSHIQALIMDRAAALLRRGGRLVYSTCTILPEENELLIDNFLSRHEEFSINRNPEVPVPAPALIGGDGFFRTAPDISGTDGFFAAILEKD
ncbi:MAG: Ribosomal RNA small subunit methyltransferase B [Syntrophus sp. PtaU1.Bin208]|nr:MAG: Ribosomal RNA small subunit methyltransferase B [Syntrophus sp. PtaU1.Bin208]